MSISPNLFFEEVEHSFESKISASGSSRVRDVVDALLDSILVRLEFKLDGRSGRERHDRHSHAAAPEVELVDELLGEVLHAIEVVRAHTSARVQCDDDVHDDPAAVTEGGKADAVAVRLAEEAVVATRN